MAKTVVRENESIKEEIDRELKEIKVEPIKEEKKEEKKESWENM